MHVTSSSGRPLCSTTLSAAAVRLEQHLEYGRASVPELGPAPAAIAKASAELAMKAGDRLGGAAGLFQCACGTFLGGVFGNVLPHGQVVRRMGVFVSASCFRRLLRGMA